METNRSQKRGFVEIQVLNLLTESKARIVGISCTDFFNHLGIISNAAEGLL